MIINSNVVNIPPPPLVELTGNIKKLRSQGKHVIDLSQAMVNFPQPQGFREGVIKAMESGASEAYAPDQGLLELRVKLADYLSFAFGVTWDPEDELMITAGANQAAFLAMTCVFSPGDRVLLFSPYYFNHHMALSMLGTVPETVQGKPEKGFVPRPNDLADIIDSRTRGIVIVNPNNPTGARYRNSLSKDLCSLTAEKDLFLVSDQTYHEIYFGLDAPLSPASDSSCRNRTATVGSFSKSLGLAGWRIGFLAGPSPLIREALKVQDTSIICAPTASQLGLLAALDKAPKHVEQVRKALKARRDSLMESLFDSGYGDYFSEPGGAVFLFFKLPKGMDDISSSRQLLESKLVAVVPGSVFGPGGKGYWRISFGTAYKEDLVEAGKRIAEYLKENQN
ncbi:MAG: pyridoxal phosphate-dependent aminotransferase [Deltaproteobacteria bacterium]|nr:pyridoxal phosphate-dependent aminotransferase [Deltaproteobacteria bacterium]